MIEVHNIVILERPAGTPAGSALPDGLHYVERGVGDVERIARSDRAHGRKGDIARIERRFAHGLRYFSIEDGDSPVAWFWVAVGCLRYFDEMCWQVPMAPDQGWARDAFVVPSHRGRRLLVALMHAASAAEGRSVQLFSDVDAINLPSLRAHVALGFRRLCTVRGLSLGPLHLRMRPPAAIPAPEALRPEARLLWLSRDERAWHRAHVA